MPEMAFVLGFERWAEFHQAEKRKEDISGRGDSLGCFSLFGAKCVV